MLGFMGRILAGVIALCAVAGHALAQAAVTQSGPVVPFHAAMWAANGILADGGQYCSPTAPTVVSAGTSPSILDNNGTCSFTVNVGTGGTASAAVIGLPGASNGWTCVASDITTQSTSVFLQRQTASTTSSATITNYNTAGTATAFVASDRLRMSCHGD